MPGTEVRISVSRALGWRVSSCSRVMALEAERLSNTPVPVRVEVTTIGLSTRAPPGSITVSAPETSAASSCATDGTVASAPITQDITIRTGVLRQVPGMSSIFLLKIDEPSCRLHERSQASQQEVSLVE